MKDQVVNFNYDYYNLTNAVTNTVLDEEDFYNHIGQLYRISRRTAQKYMTEYNVKLLTD